MTLVVWNFTGQDRYKSLQPRYMSGVSGILLLFDITRKETFEKLTDWIDFIEQNEANVPILLVGSMADMFYKKSVPDKEIEDFVNQNRLQGYSEVSFKTGLNVEPTIRKISELSYRLNEKRPLPSAQFKLTRRYPDRPIIEDEKKVIDEYVLTLQTIYNMVFIEISARIKELEKSAHKIVGEESPDKLRVDLIQEELNKIFEEIKLQSTRIKYVQENPPVSFPTGLRIDLIEDWRKKREELRSQLSIFKKSFKFLEGS